MSALRVTTQLRSLAVSRYPSRAPISLTSNQSRRLYAHESSSYGGGEGDPKGENPSDQGANPSADKEHPGPPPPQAGQGTGGGPTKGGDSGQGTQEGQSNSSGGSQGVSGSSSKPRILQENNPEHSEEVKRHNEEYSKRHDRPSEHADDQGKDTVSKGYWSGECQSTIIRVYGYASDFHRPWWSRSESVGWFASCDDSGAYGFQPSRFDWAIRMEQCIGLALLHHIEQNIYHGLMWRIDSNLLQSLLLHVLSTFR